jgi:hypothetical protein
MVRLGTAPTAVIRLEDVMPEDEVVGQGECTPEGISTEATLFQARRMTDVMSRIAVDVEAALKRNNGMSVITAVLKCERCACYMDCDAWVASHEEGERHEAPDFCPSARFMQSLRSAKPTD